MHLGYAEQRTHGLRPARHQRLFAALDIATGKFIGLCKNGPGTQEFRPCSGTSPGPTPTASCTSDGQLSAHKNPNVRAWLASNPRIQVHFTPTSGSWLNLVVVGSPSSNAGHPPRQLPVRP